MGKFIVMSGFLGAGKTTTMMALTDEFNRRGLVSRMIANDLGAKNLVDAQYTAAQGYDIAAMPGECICFQTENLIDKLRRFFVFEHADIAMSDIPGLGVGALDEVYHKIHNNYPDECDLGPFTVVTDPLRLRTLVNDEENDHLPREIRFLYRAQLTEADLVLLNKIDTLSSEETEELTEFLIQACPGVKVIPVSAKTGIGIREAADWLIGHSASLKPFEFSNRDYIDFAKAEDLLSWYNRQFFVSGSRTFDANLFVDELVEAIRALLKKHAGNVPHLKLFAEKNGEDSDICKVSLLGTDYQTEHDRLMREPDTQVLSVTINARAACKPALLNEIMDAALACVLGQFDLSGRIFFTECFGMTEEGRMA